MPTAQETFNTVVNHLRKQNCKSINVNKECLYRGPNGTKCAVGCLIPDDKYDIKLEGLTITSYTIKNLLKSLGYGEDTFGLLTELQSTHDHYPIKEWEKQFSDCEYLYKVIIPEKV